MRFGDGAHRINAVEGTLAVHRREVELRAAAAFLDLRVAPVLAAQQPAGQRAPDHQAHAFALEHGDDLALQVAPGHRVVSLQRHELREAQPLADTQRLGDLPRRPVRHADITHMPVAHQLVERSERLLHRRGGVETVQLVQVDVVELQARQARLHAVENVAARRAARVRAGARVAEHLGRHHHVVACHLQVLQRLARDLLGRAARVHVGRVDEVDAGVQRLADQAFGVGLLQVADLAPDAAGAAEGHGAQAEFRDEQAGAAEGVVAHGVLLR